MSKSIGVLDGLEAGSLWPDVVNPKAETHSPQSAVRRQGWKGRGPAPERVLARDGIGEASWVVRAKLA